MPIFQVFQEMILESIYSRLVDKLPIIPRYIKLSYHIIKRLKIFFSIMAMIIILQKAMLCWEIFYNAQKMEFYYHIYIALLHSF